MEDDDSASSCPFCANPILNIDQPVFYSCGCVVCWECYKEDNSPCERHNEQVNEDLMRKVEVKQMIKTLKKHANEYEKTYSADRSQFDASVRAVRDYFKRITTATAQPSLSSSVSIQNCPKCYRAMGNGQCPCSQLWVCKYSDCMFAENPWDSWDCGRCKRRYCDTEVTVWNCARCSQATSGQQCEHCGAGQSQQKPQPARSAQQWQCERCRQTFPSSVSQCSYCTQTQSRTVKPQPTSDQSYWTCSYCGNSNYATSVACYSCRTQRSQIQPVPVARGNPPWQCPKCFNPNSAEATQCEHCQSPVKPTVKSAALRTCKYCGESIDSSICSYCGRNNDAASQQVRTVPEKRGDSSAECWVCKCNLKMQPSTTRCLTCKALNPQLSPERGRTGRSGAGYR